MVYWHLPVLFAMIGVMAACEPPSADTASVRPNVLLIVLDDFGYNDLGVNGNPATPTPNLNSFAAEGIRFTRHYADASCSVSRAGIMTGTYPARNGLRPNHLGLSKGTPTIASALRDAGYYTQHIGKWHIASATPDQSPGQLGFDSWFGFLHQNELREPSKDGIHFSAPTYLNPWLRENDSPLVRHTGHLETILTDRAVAFLEQRGETPTQPWFLNLWFFAPHKPIQPAQSFRSKYPADAAGAYHALIDQLDFNIGRVLHVLDATGQRENTLVIVLSDNGGTNEQVDNNYPYHGKKTELLEGGVRTPLLMRWPGHIAANAVSDETVSIYDIFPTIAGAAAARMPEFVIGRNLLDPDRGESPELYWEYASDQYQTYSALSADGRWRLTNDIYNVATLNDLHADPTGKVDVLKDNPQIAAALRQNYLNWSRQVRTVDYAYEALNDRGAAILTGNDLLRSPGYGGFTFAIGITPSADQHQHYDQDDAIEGRPQVIVEQTGRWQIGRLPDGSLALDVLGESVKLPPLPTGRCSELVLSSYYGFSPIQPKYNRATTRVYVDGKSVYSKTTPNPALQTGGYLNPTYVGSSAGGEDPFQGKLSRPIILNQAVVPDSEGEKTGNGISTVDASCAPD